MVTMVFKLSTTFGLTDDNQKALDALRVHPQQSPQHNVLVVCITSGCPGAQFCCTAKMGSSRSTFTSLQHQHQNHWTADGF